MADAPESPLVVFDVGAVLLRLNYPAFFGRLNSLTGLSQEDLRSRIAPLEAQAMRNEKFDYYNVASSALRIQRGDFAAAHTLVLDSPISPMVLLKQRLHEAGNEIGIASNIDRYGHMILKSRWPEMLEAWGGPSFYSYERGVIKPDPMAYKAFPARENIIFIDDKESYLAAAEPFGWKGIHYSECIDPSEAVRSMAGHESKLSPNTRSAPTIDAVVAALKDYGAKF